MDEKKSIVMDEKKSREVLANLSKKYKEQYVSTSNSSGNTPALDTGKDDGPPVIQKNPSQTHVDTGKDERPVDTGKDERSSVDTGKDDGERQDFIFSRL